MNRGLFDGLNTFTRDHALYTGVWGNLRGVTGTDEPGFQQRVGASATTLSQNLMLPVHAVVGTAPTSQLGQSAWVSYVDALPFDAQAFQFSPTGTMNISGGYVHLFVDVAYSPPGSGGKETVILDSFLLGSRYTYSSAVGDADWCGPFPLFIPAGSRVMYRFRVFADRHQAFSIGMTMHFHRRHPRPGNRAVLVSQYSAGTSIPTPGSNDADSAYGTVGTLPFDTSWVVPCQAILGTNVAYGAGGGWAIDYAYVDRDGTVVNFLENIPGMAKTAESQWNLNRPYPVNLAAGTEVQARGRFGDTANATGFTPAFIAIGSDPSAGCHVRSMRTGSPQTWPQ